jgi:hypothetical protein
MRPWRRRFYRDLLDAQRAARALAAILEQRPRSPTLARLLRPL